MGLLVSLLRPQPSGANVAHTNVEVMTTPKTSVGSDTIAQASGSYFGGHRSIVAQNDYHEFDVYLDAGTYNVESFVTLSSGGGIISFLLDGVEIGTVDTYNAAGGTGRVRVATLLSVTTSGAKTVRLSVTTKHASSSAYTSRISRLVFVKTPFT